VASVGWQLTYIVSMASVLGALSWNAGNKILGASHGVLFINFVPLTAFTIRIIQGHRFEPIEFVGAALVIAALVGSYMVRHAATVVWIIQRRDVSTRDDPEEGWQGAPLL